MANVISRQSPVRLGVVVVGVAVVSWESGEFVAAIRIVLKLRPCVVGLKLEASRIPLLNADVPAVVFRGADIGIEDLDILELGKWPQSLRQRRIRIRLRKQRRRYLIDAVLTACIVGYRQTVAERPQIAHVKQPVVAKLALNVEARLI